jgi:hypothetical protein
MRLKVVKRVIKVIDCLDDATHLCIESVPQQSETSERPKRDRIWVFSRWLSPRAAKNLADAIYKALGFDRSEASYPLYADGAHHEAMTIEFKTRVPK